MAAELLPLMRAGVVLIPGVEVRDAAWAGAVADRLATRVLEEAAVVPTQEPPGCIEEMVAVGAVVWADAARADGADGEAQTVRGPWARRAWTRLAGRSATQERERLAAWLRGCAMARDPSVHAELRARLERAVAGWRDAAGGAVPITLVAEGLGASVLLETLRRSPGWSPAGARMANLFTLGPPLATLRGPDGAILEPPRLPTDVRLRWVNFFDAADPLSGPLRALGPAWRAVVLKDAQLDAGEFLRGPAAAFEESGTLTVIARKVALDWLAGHGRLPPKEQQVYDMAWDEALTV